MPLPFVCLSFLGSAAEIRRCKQPSAVIGAVLRRAQGGACSGWGMLRVGHAQGGAAQGGHCSGWALSQGGHCLWVGTVSGWALSLGGHCLRVGTCPPDPRYDIVDNGNRRGT
jgi:hypothetical protein